MKAFLRYYVENLTEIAEAAQFIPLNDEQATETDAKLEDAIAQAGG